MTNRWSQTCLQALAAGEVGLLDLCERCTELVIQALRLRLAQRATGHRQDTPGHRQDTGGQPSGSADPPSATCRACGAQFGPSRRDAVYCSARCRKRGNRNGGPVAERRH